MLNKGGLFVFVVVLCIMTATTVAAATGRPKPDESIAIPVVLQTSEIASLLYFAETVADVPSRTPLLKEIYARNSLSDAARIAGIRAAFDSVTTLRFFERQRISLVNVSSCKTSRTCWKLPRRSQKTWTIFGDESSECCRPA